MRHANISITMAYYANVDDAVEVAVLGPQRNTSRNTLPEAEPVAESLIDVSDYGETTNQP
jgi:hypothetical protein